MRDFAWLKDATSGGMDIDLMVERNKNFLFVEGKPWMGNGVTVPWGQHKALYALSCQPATRVYLVGEDKGEQVHVLHYNISPAPIYVRAQKMAWFPAERFIPTNREELSKMVNAWWRDAGEKNR